MTEPSNPLAGEKPSNPLAGEKPSNPLAGEKRYRKLPGNRRGIFHGASVWIGSGHLLSVRSSRFGEEYKRFYLRDVQAIAVARKPRFHISTRSIAIGAALFVAHQFLRVRVEWADAAFGTLASILIAAWLFVSAACSCTCRIFTAVSRDTLPSIYRTWTARRFLAAVAPRIAEVQGVIEGDWTAIVERKPAGPIALPPVEPGHAAPAEPAPVAARAVPPAPASLRRASPLAAYVFIAGLLADALVNALTMQSNSRVVFWTLYGLTLVQVITCIAILVQYHRGVLRLAMQRLAIVSLLATGALFYIQQVTAGIREQKGRPLAASVPATRGPLPLIWIGIAADAALGLAGLVILMRRDADQ